VSSQVLHDAVVYSARLAPPSARAAPRTLLRALLRAPLREEAWLRFWFCDARRRRRAGGVASRRHGENWRRRVGGAPLSRARDG